MKPRISQRRNRRGLSSIEYALLASLVAVGTIVALSTMSHQLSASFNSIGTLIGAQKAPVIQGGGGGGGGGSFH